VSQVILLSLLSTVYTAHLIHNSTVLSHIVYLCHNP